MFTEEMARQILKIQFSEEDHSRYQTLSLKAQEGELTPEEQADLDDYLNLNDLLIVMKTKAESFLRARDSAA
jgi:hypothetical protein